MVVRLQKFFRNIFVHKLSNHKKIKHILTNAYVLKFHINEILKKIKKSSLRVIHFNTLATVITGFQKFRSWENMTENQYL